MISTERYLGEACRINSIEAESRKSAYALGKYVASQKPKLTLETQKILDELRDKKISINLSNVKK